jgi:serine/threonine protein kinase
VKGETLDRVKLLKRHKLLRVFEKVAAGMVHMHRRNVLHADLKPNNIMLGRGGAVKVLDYGLAWIKGEPKDRVQGTPEYLAPETASHKLVNERTDIFNFGATMYRLVTFKLPPPVISDLAGVPMTEKTYKSVYKPVGEVVATTPPKLCDLIHKCMEFKAAKRPESFAEIQAALSAMADEAEKGLDPAELEE